MMSQSSRVTAIWRLILPVLSLVIVLEAQKGWAQGSSTLNPQVRMQLAPPTAVPSGGAAPALATPSTEVFERFQRFPTEVQNFIQMNGTPPAAYYRDEFVGGETLTSGANDGDTIYAQLFDSTGAPLITWASIVFHSSYVFNGQTLQNCWVAPGVQPLCGSNAIDVNWYYQSQCNDGNFTQQFYLNGAPIAAAPFPFTVLPQIEESRVPNYSQVETSAGVVEEGSGYEYDFECRYADANGVPLSKDEKHTCTRPSLAADEIPYYIHAKGCYLSDAANITSYHGAMTGLTVDPPTLNTALIQMTLNPTSATPPFPPGYTNYKVSPLAVDRYSGDRHVQLSFINDTSTANLNGNICHYGPQIIGVICQPDKKGVQKATHWVTAFGMTSNKTSWLIHDPGHFATDSTGAITGESADLTKRYGNTFCEARYFSGPQFTFVTQTGLTIAFHSPVELMITDPLGRRLGGDPTLAVEYNEIPGAYYEPLGLVDDATGIDESDPAKTLFIPAAASGQYTLTVLGTDTSAYSAQFISEDANGTPSELDMNNIPIGLNELQTFTINYSSTAGSTLQLSGGFAGGGQNPAVNQFLTYAKPGDSHVSLVTGTQSYTVVIFYSNAVIASTFSATLNGNSVSNLFNPQPGTSQAVSVPLQPGRNLLDLKIDGNLPTRVATDTDRLVFDVE